MAAVPDTRQDEDVAEQADWDLPVWSPDTFDLDRELRVNAALEQADLDELVEWAERQRTFPPLTDRDVVKFLHSSGYDVLAAKQCINYYYSCRVSSPGLFHKRDMRLPHLQAQMKIMDLFVCPRLTPDGYRVIVNGLTESDPTNYVFEDHQKVMLMMLDALVLAEPTLPGVYIIYDLHLGLISHFWKFGFWTQRKLFSYLRNGLPMVLKGCITLHTPSYIGKVMKVLKTIGDRERLEETVMYEGDDYTELHQFIPKECLPSDYGGTLPSRAELHEQNCRRLASLQEYFEKDEEALLRK